MPVQITYHGHACFSIQTGAANLLIDPFLTGNAMADVTPEQVAPDHILVTHAARRSPGGCAAYRQTHGRAR